MARHNRTLPSHKLVQKIVSEVQAGVLSKGSLLPHSVIEACMGISYRSQCGHVNGVYTYYVAKANKQLTASNLRIQAVKGFGYRILLDSEYSNVARQLFNAGAKYFDTALFILSNADTSQLSPIELNAYNDIHGKVTKAITYVSTL